MLYFPYIFLFKVHATDMKISSVTQTKVQGSFLLRMNSLEENTNKCRLNLLQKVTFL